MLTLGLGAFYRTIAGGAAGEQRVERAAVTVQIAKSQLAAAGIERPLAIGATEGSDASGYRWTIRVQRYDDGARSPAGSGPLAYLVTSTVTWPGRLGTSHPSVELTTIKVAPAS